MSEENCSVKSQLQSLRATAAKSNFAACFSYAKYSFRVRFHKKIFKLFKWFNSNENLALPPQEIDFSFKELEQLRKSTANCWNKWTKTLNGDDV
jgi:hypothetical protein